MRKNIVQYLLETAERYPNKNAVVELSKSITFSQLVNNAKVISSALLSKIGSNQPVAVYIPKGCNMMSAFAGVNLSGSFYIPLDTKSPNARVSAILETVKTNIVITDRARQAHLSEFYTGEVFVIEDILEKGYDGYSAFDGMNNNVDVDPVYSIFTSGSTGVPKGVVISHRCLIDYIECVVDTFHFDSTTTIGNQAQFYFDLSVLDIYLMYVTGATLDIIPDKCFLFPAELVDHLDDHQITFISWVPSALVNVANTNILSKKQPKYLRDVLFCGEIMPNKHLNHWRKYLPDCRYVNQYGPTEITVACTYYEIDREFTDDEPLPIGKPYENSDIIILVDRKRRAEKGEQGELCVRGSSVALGYYNAPEKTAGAFISNPLHDHYPETIYCTGDIVYESDRGELMYVGRVDAQIKHNGYRIELGEIEIAILGSNMVDNCCVVYDFGNKKIVLFYEAAEELNMVQFRKYVASKVPRYMLPSEYIREDLLKKNANGKIDRAFYNKKINK